ncbi:MAG TPA: UbiA family prenyltransferase [Ktedonobacteraceae bacterium]|nr:UbiA family prenyltransferase [Ktedonobacteraceae bacterium]
MQVARKRPLTVRLRGLVLLGHPGPVLFHAIAVTVFALLAAWPRPVWWVLLLLIGAHTAMQLAIAVFNDYCDRKRDALGKPGKPIPGGLVTPREALLAGCVLLALMVILLAPLPPLSWLLTLGYLALGMAYNLGLKSTPFSGPVFALAMPLIPLYAFASVGRGLNALAWLLLMGVLLGVALNLANSLPDLEEDARTGARTLAVVLGLRNSFLLSESLLILDALLILILHLSGAQRMPPLVLVLTLLVSGLLLAILLIFTGPHKARATRKLFFYLTVLICLVLAGGWLIGVLI